MSPSEIEAFTRQYYQWFNERRFEEAETLVDAQAIFTYPAAREHFIGRAGYRELARRWAEAFPDAMLSIVRVQVADDTARTDWIGKGTHLGVLDLPGLPSIPPTHRAAELPMRETIRIAGGLIVESRMNFDIEELRRRLGL